MFRRQYSVLTLALLCVCVAGGKPEQGGGPYETVLGSDLVYAATPIELITPREAPPSSYYITMINPQTETHTEDRRTHTHAA